MTFPQDLIENGLLANKHAMLGLGDIVIPGIFIAILLRFDMRYLTSLQTTTLLFAFYFSIRQFFSFNFCLLSLNRNNSQVYFKSTFVAYILALFLTIFIMHVFKHAQPALLYIVPLILVVPLSIALIRGDLKEMFA